MKSIRLPILIGILLVAFALTGSTLAAARELRQAVLLQPDLASSLAQPDSQSQTQPAAEDPQMRVNYGQDWVGANYDPDHSFTITLLDPDGAVKSTALVESATGGGWMGDGFQTEGWQWQPQYPDILPGDQVVFEADDGFERELWVGEISGTIDLDGDEISGPVFAGWYTDDLDITCQAWGSPGVDPRSSTAGPDGDPPYSCNWTGEWDIQPGQDVAVMYSDPQTQDNIINTFHVAAPDMAINVSVEGSGYVLPGGPVIFTIEYTNQGDAPAPFAIVDWLPANTTYLDDSSGVPADTGAGYVSWNFGVLQPGVTSSFQVVLSTTAAPGDTLLNEVEIIAPGDADDSNNTASADALVGEGEFNLNVRKQPTPVDPAPGETMIYNIVYGNLDAYTSLPVTLTEILPAGTSLVDWYSENQFNLWEEVGYNGSELTLRVDGIPGYWGDTLRLVLLVDEGVSYGTVLTNTVEIAAPGDANPSNNWYQDDTAVVKEPRLDGRIEKTIKEARTFPGGQLVYGVVVANDGNVPFNAQITDRLPTGTTFDHSVAYRHGDPFTFLPAYMDDEVVIWNYPDLLPGEWIDMEIYLNIDPDIEPGTVVDNCAILYTSDEETAPFNNAACTEETIKEYGPNIRLKKFYSWNSESQIQYELRIENIGTQPLESIWITDTYPLSTTWNGNFWHNYGAAITMTADIPNHRLFLWTNGMAPGDSASVGFQVNLDSEIIGEYGLTFDNLAEAPLPGDVNPADNEVVVTAFTGPDVYVIKWLSAGDPLPGEVITYTVAFGNRNLWPWDGDLNFGSHITDTLPAGMSFLYATAPWDINQVWEPESQDGGVLSWAWEPMWADTTHHFKIVVRLDDDLQDHAVLVNTIEAYSDNPDEFDFDPSNNVSEFTIVIRLPEFELFLPLINR